MKIRILFLATVAALGMVQAAHAQSGDAVVMRRALDPKTRTYAWIPTEWSECSNSCGPGQQTRSVQCTMNGKLGAPEVNCTPNRPAEAQSCYSVTGCSFTWKESDWTDVQGCGSVVETRTLSCLRADGQTVPNDQCAQPVPDTTRTVRDLRTCSYSWKAEEWSAWSDFCKTGATRDRAVHCLRSNGETVEDSFCATAGEKPVASESSNRYEQCGYSWKSTDWGAWSSTCQTGATHSREVTCQRSNGDTVPDAMCSGLGVKPAVTETGDRYESCSYSWRPGEYGALAPACGATTRIRSMECVRSNGDLVGDASCTATKPPVSEAGVDYSTCSYDWKPGEWSAPSTTCGSATSTRTVTCLSSDGRSVADSFCKTTKPDVSRTTAETSGCSYTWVPGGWGASVPACGATVQNRAITCLRSDGQTVADGSCDPAKRPAAQQPATDYSTCTYGWTTSSYGAWSSTCGTATQTRSVTCQSSDGRTVADSFCPPASKPDASQSSYQTTGCTYSWLSGAFGAPAPACGATTQTRTVTCRRSDVADVPDASCSAAGPRPSPTQPATDYSTCGYSWSPGAWSAPSSTCGQATQTRSITCLRSDGTTVADASCSAAGAKPDASQASYQTTGCGYSWTPGAWGGSNSSCSRRAVQTRSISCTRSDGQTVASSFCSAVAQPATSQTLADFSGCQNYYFGAGGWTDWSSHCSASATRTMPIGCFRNETECRSTDDDFWGFHRPGVSNDCSKKIADTSCTDPASATAGYSPASGKETAAVYDQCGYTWQTGAWGGSTPACGASSQSRSVFCQRSDGTTVADSSCNAGTRPAATQATTDYSACGYNWIYSGWTTTAQTCGSVSQTRTVSCQRADGTIVADGYCTAAKPAASQSYADYSSCTYSAVNPGAWTGWDSACSGSATRHRYYQCRRADGAIVDGSECVNRGIGVDEAQTGANYTDACPGYVATGGWSDYNSHCSGSATRTRSVQCYRAGDNILAPDQYCTDRGVGIPARSETTGVYDGCGYGWAASGYRTPSGCGSVTASQDVWCQRSDGARVGDASCGGGRPADTVQTTDYGSCSYSGAYGAFGACTNGQQTRYNSCRRSDGAGVDGSFCGITNSDTQGCTSVCRVAPTYNMTRGSTSFSGEGNSTYQICAQNGATARGWTNIRVNGTNYQVSSQCTITNGSCKRTTDNVVNGVNYQVMIDYQGGSGGTCLSYMTVANMPGATCG